MASLVGVITVGLNEQILCSYELFNKIRSGCRSYVDFVTSVHLYGVHEVLLLYNKIVLLCTELVITDCVGIRTFRKVNSYF